MELESGNCVLLKVGKGVQGQYAHMVPRKIAEPGRALTHRAADASEAPSPPPLSQVMASGGSSCVAPVRVPVFQRDGLSQCRFLL